MRQAHSQSATETRDAFRLFVELWIEALVGHCTGDDGTTKQINRMFKLNGNAQCESGIRGSNATYRKATVALIVLNTAGPWATFTVSFAPCSTIHVAVAVEFVRNGGWQLSSSWGTRRRI
jgi:hypothetical protein